MVDTAVLEVEIVSVFPNVHAQQGVEAVAEGVVAVRLFGDDEFAVLILRKPSPARTKEGGSGLSELLFELFKAAESGVDGLGDFAFRSVVFYGCLKLEEVEVVVEELASIVEDRPLVCPALL